MHPLEPMRGTFVKLPQLVITSSLGVLKAYQQIDCSLREAILWVHSFLSMEGITTDLGKI